MDLDHLQRTAWEIAESKGLHENLDGLPLREATLIRLALIFTEVAEATQLVKRHGVSTDASPSARYLLANLGEELADILIRVGDLAQGLGIDLSEAVDHKLAVNRVRPQFFGTPRETRDDTEQ